ncbi:MAG: D-aminoacyl-tRNA deacylase [Catalinimonas sp.]
MLTVIQRVKSAEVRIDGVVRGQVGAGLLVLLGIGHDDGPDDVAYLSRKITQLRIFADAAGKMNRSVRDVGGGILLVSQFTLHADTRKGHRPSYVAAAPPAVAEPLYERMIHQLAADLGQPIATGRFGADMQVSLLNDGPVTIVLDSRQRK